MEYGVLESYGFSVLTSLVNQKNVWIIRKYGLSEVWFMRESTEQCLPAFSCTSAATHRYQAGLLGFAMRYNLLS